VQERKEPQEKAAEEAQLAAWGAALPELYPEIAGERMVDVVPVSAGRLLLLTDLHVALLKARHLSQNIESQHMSMSLCTLA
jgi:hypothetical protein